MVQSVDKACLWCLFGIRHVVIFLFFITYSCLTCIALNLHKHPLYIEWWWWWLLLISDTLIRPFTTFFFFFSCCTNSQILSHVCFGKILTPLDFKISFREIGTNRSGNRIFTGKRSCTCTSMTRGNRIL